jgi:D-tyrosyl-tRNA(Tyr) deacylase
VRAVIQRVKKASVSVDGNVVGCIGEGVVVFLGVSVKDTSKDSCALARKIAGLRIFEDKAGKLNLSMQDLGFSALVISQFTLYGDCRKGRRPSFSEAAPPSQAKDLYEDFIRELSNLGIPVAQGSFQAKMLVEVHNAGPVTLIVDTRNE